ncbi:zinc/manganese transport system permease protein/zinc transport system permease protein [Verrucomicrobium sp. GAS474]|uniref:metal ABC transporter permease n=1 Tax=Verrucomicrobium sp. GAS474 TaxID=1882831 RepID=UPI00087B6160|nr:metal ABC transporter permease [Verrucomicrobium sp. GAS474]SDT87325.1 zinc/manganese transport system permease protein/zinc transport system permease protein [Verrucomicrobium sp. GAS474]
MSLLDLWHFPFVRNALLSALLLGPVCAYLGVFITLRGMSFFSDALAHAALTGIALGFVVQAVWPWMPLLPVVLLFSLLLAAGMAQIAEQTTLRPDAIIAFSFTGSVALGVAVLSKLGKYRLIDSLLFGDIYASGKADLLAQAALALVLFAFLGWNRRAFLLGIVQPDLARVEGLPVARLNLLFALVVAATVTVCIQMLGTLLLSGLIVIPATAARLVARDFAGMTRAALLLGGAGAVGGIIVSCLFDLPAGPSIILLDIAILLGCRAVAGRR